MTTTPPVTSPGPPRSGDVSARLDAIERQLAELTRTVNAVLIAADHLVSIVRPLVERFNAGGLAALVRRKT